MVELSTERRPTIFVLVLVTLLSYGIKPAFAAAGDSEGEAWLHMNPDTRAGFVWGYTIGLSRGFAQGCEAYRGAAPFKSHDIHDDPFAKCLSGGKGFSRSVEHYVSKVSEFYESYPSDRELSFEEVLKRLSDSENMTPAQIHQWFELHQRSK